MALRGTAIKTTAARLAESRVQQAADLSRAPLVAGRYPCEIVTNNGDGSYTVDIYGEGGTAIREDVLCWPWPATALLEVGEQLFVDVKPGNPVPTIDAAGGAGSGGAGDSITVGAPGFLSGT